MLQFAKQALSTDGYEVILRKRPVRDGAPDQQETDKLLASSDENPVVTKIIPAFVMPFRFQNFGLLISYFNTGVAFMLLVTPVTYYLIDTLGCSSAEVSAFSTLVYLPWSLKFIFGIITDTVDIFGSRRKSWMIIGWSTYVLLNFVLYFFSKPGLLLITTLMFISTCGYLQSDVCNDALSVERGRMECVEIKGSFQTAVYSIRSFGFIIGAIQASLLYNTSSWGWGLTLPQLFLLAMLIPLLTVLPMTYFIPELPLKIAPPTVVDSFWKVWEVLQMKAAWCPMAFFLVYGSLQLPNASWSNFLILSLDFSDFDTGLLTIGGSVGYFIGLQIYQNILFTRDFKEVVLVYGLLFALTNLAQLVLIYQWNLVFGVSNVAFAVFLYTIQYMLSVMNSMPLTVMCVMVCPKQSEGIMYAVLTTMTNLSSTIALDLATMLTYAVDVSNTSLEAGNYTGLIQTVWISTAAQLVPLITLLPFVPSTRDEEQKLIDSNERSVYGGGALIAYVIASLVLTLVLNFIVIAA